jgi:hypothetical protein
MIEGLKENRLPSGSPTVSQLMRSGTVDWRDAVKLGSGTVVTITGSIRALELERSQGVFSDPKMVDRIERLQKLLENTYKKIKDDESPKLKLNPESYDSSTLVFDLNRRKCEFNVEFETAFLSSAKELGFAGMVVHDNIYSVGTYKLVDADGVDIIVEAEKTPIWI